MSLHRSRRGVACGSGTTATHNCVTATQLTPHHGFHTPRLLLLLLLFTTCTTFLNVHHVQIIDEAVQLEDEFCTEALSCELLGMNAELMRLYIRWGRTDGLGG